MPIITHSPPAVKLGRAFRVRGEMNDFHKPNERLNPANCRWESLAVRPSQEADP